MPPHRQQHRDRRYHQAGGHDDDRHHTAGSPRVGPQSCHVDACRNRLQPRPAARHQRQAGRQDDGQQDHCARQPHGRWSEGRNQRSPTTFISRPSRARMTPGSKSRSETIGLADTRQERVPRCIRPGHGVQRTEDPDDGKVDQLRRQREQDEIDADEDDVPGGEQGSIGFRRLRKQDADDRIHHDHQRIWRIVRTGRPGRRGKPARLAASANTSRPDAQMHASPDAGPERGTGSIAGSTVRGSCRPGTPTGSSADARPMPMGREPNR